MLSTVGAKRTTWSLAHVALAAGTVAGMSVPPALAQRNAVDLRPKFEAGMVTRYSSRSDITHHAIADGISQGTTIISTESGMRVRVLRLLEDGAAELDWTLEFVVIRTTGEVPGIAGRLDFDSREPGNGTSPLAPMFAQLVGRPMTFSVDRSGRVTRSDDAPRAAGNAVLDQLLGGFFANDIFEQLPFFVTAGAPSPARKKDTWQQDTDVRMPLGLASMRLSTTYKLTKFKRRKHEAVIDTHGTVGLNSGSSNPGTSLVVDHDQFTGAITWDTAAGQLKEADSRMEIGATLPSVLGRMRIEQLIISHVERTSTEHDSIRRTSPSPPRNEPPAEE